MAEEKKKRIDLSLQEKRKILEIYDKLPKMSQRNAAVYLKISQPLLCKILKNRTNIETALMSNQNMNRKRERSGKDNQVESALKIWFRKVCDKNAPINKPIMCQKAEELAKIMGKEDFVATDGWFNRWKRRENIVFKQVHSEENNTGFPASNKKIKTKLPKIICDYPPQDIYIVSETELYFHSVPDHNYSFKNETSTKYKSLKEQITVLCCVNILGEKQDLVVVGKSQNPQSFKGIKNLPVKYFSDENCSVNSSIFSNWLIKWDHELWQKILVLIDKSVVSTNNLTLKNIKIMCLSSLNHPLHQSIAQTLKDYYFREIQEKILPTLDNRNESDANAIAKKISLLDALHLLAMAWNYVPKQAIKNCLEKAGFSKSYIGKQAFEKLDCADGKNEVILRDTPNSDFKDWTDLDENIEVINTMNISDMCEVVVDEDSKISKESKYSTLTDEEISEAPPTNAQMQDALRILRRGVQYRAKNFEKHYEYEKYIQELINLKDQ